MRMVRQFSDPPKPFRGKAERRLLHIGEHKPGRKRAANVSIDEDILAAAKAMNINLSQTLEKELRRRVQAERDEKWRRENRSAIESYNRFIEKHGVFLEEFQDWDESSV
jgi:antitoxin CcdA